MATPQQMAQANIAKADAVHIWDNLVDLQLMIYHSVGLL